MRVHPYGSTKRPIKQLGMPCALRARAPLRRRVECAPALSGRTHSRRRPSREPLAPLTTFSPKRNEPSSAGSTCATNPAIKTSLMNKSVPGVWVYRILYNFWQWQLINYWDDCHLELIPRPNSQSSATEMNCQSVFECENAWSGASCAREPAASSWFNMCRNATNPRISGQFGFILRSRCGTKILLSGS